MVDDVGTLMNRIWEWSELNAFERCEDNLNQGRGIKICSYRMQSHRVFLHKEV